MFRRNRAIISPYTHRSSLLVQRWAQPFSKQKIAHALRVLAPTLVALSVAGVANIAHAQGTMDFSGAQTLMGSFKTIRRALLHQSNVHTLLRLPIGIWYSPGVKANVLFFDKKPRAKAPATKELWVYDLRSGQNFSLRQNPIASEYFTDSPVVLATFSSVQQS
jgi:hypothetical protein